MAAANGSAPSIVQVPSLAKHRFLRDTAGADALSAWLGGVLGAAKASGPRRSPHVSPGGSPGGQVMRV